MEKVKNYLKIINEVISKGRFKDNWESLKQWVTPSWYTDAKFGIFIHWGLYSIPAFDNEWYSRNMYIKGSKVYEHHVKTYGNHKEFGYKDFIPMFTATEFAAAKWAELFAEAGARYVMPVAEHHDGFQLYASDLSQYNSLVMGPKKDILAELKKELEARGIVLAASTHRLEHYFFMSGGRLFDSDIKDPKYGDLYWPSIVIPSDQLIEGVHIPKEYMDDWLARTCELIDKYRPKVIYFDWWIQIECMKPYLQKFAAYYYNRGDEWGEAVAINYKLDAFMHKTAVNDVERGFLSTTSPDFWQCCTSVAKNSWGYTENNEYKQPNDIICDLIDIVSKNGTMLLNIGPKADGSIPDQDRDILLEIGKWLKVNGEGIYGTSYWKHFGEGPTATPEGHFTDTFRDSFTSEDFRFTFRNDSIYAFALKWPEDGVVRIKTFGAAEKYYRGVIKDVAILGCETSIRTIRCKDYLSVSAPEYKSNYPVCIKITLL